MRKIVLITVFSNLLWGGQGLPPSLNDVDALYSHRGQEGVARKVLSLYREKLAANRDDVEILWRIAMAAHFVGMRYAQDEEEKEKLFEEGRDAGRRSLVLNPQCGACHFWTAINMALYGETVGVFKMLFSLKEVIEHLEKAGELDPTYALAGAYRVQALIYQKLPGIFGGDNDKAKALFEKAIELSPCELNYVVLAKFFHDVEGDEKKAGQIAQAGLNRPACEPIESREARDELEALVKITPTSEPRLLSSARNHSPG